MSVGVYVCVCACVHKWCVLVCGAACSGRGQPKRRGLRWAQALA